MANSKRKCKQCKKFYPVEQGMIVQLGFICSDECRIQYGIDNAKKLSEKSKKQIVRKKQQEVREKKNKRKQASKELREHKRRDLDWQKELTQKSFNKMRVLEEILWFQDRGLAPYCISCGRENMDWCCGHFKTRGGFPELALDRKNTFLQCNWHCNKNLSGNIEGDKYSYGYKKGLVVRFGEVEGEAVIEYCERHHPPKNWKWQELEEFRAECNARIRELEKQVELPIC